MKTSSGAPSACSRGQPNTSSAARLKSTTRCAASTVMIASMADSTMPPSRVAVAPEGRVLPGAAAFPTMA